MDRSSRTSNNKSVQRKSKRSLEMGTRSPSGSIMSLSMSNMPYQDYEEPLSECGSSEGSTITVETQNYDAVDKQIEDTERVIQGKKSITPLQHKGHYNEAEGKEASFEDPKEREQELMKYRNNYCKLLESFRILETDHRRLLETVLAGRLKDVSERKTIDGILDPFAMKVAKKKDKFDKAATKDAVSEGSDLFLAKRWKRRYYSLLDAADLIFKDYQLLHNLVESEPDKVGKMKSSSEVQLRLTDLANDFGIHNGNYEESDIGITISTAFISDLVSQCRIYRGELDKQLAIKERLFYVLKKAKDQRAKLKVYVNALRDELRYVMYKMKESQSAMANQLSANEAKQQELAEKAAEAAAMATSTKEIMGYQERISELERILKEEEARRKKLHNKLQEIIGNIRVYCRIRPQPECFIKVSSDDKIVIPADPLPDKVTRAWGAAMKCFIFDRVFAPEANQENVFDAVQELITSCVDGYNVCIMAYGQTGGGKTHTMMGTPQNPGVNRRAIKELLAVCSSRKQWTFRLCLSMLEIYNEEVRDLLTPTTKADKNMNTVRIMSNQDDEIVIQGLLEHEVNEEEDIMRYLELGEKNRRVGSTMLNIASSRSHLILLLKVFGENNVHKASSRGTLTLCDLAGSENVTKSGATGERFHEATSINKSLTALGRVFDCLRKRQKPAYRETKLTYALKPTLGGDSKCLVIVNIRSETGNIEETLRTLYFGQTAMQVAPEQAQQKTSILKGKK